MQFFEGETSLYRGFGLVVTNQRVISEDSELQSVTIDCLGMCEYEMKDKPWMWMLGALLLVAGGVIYANNNPNGGFIGAAIGAALIVAFFLTKDSVLRIYAGGSWIDVAIKGHRAEELEEAIRVMQKAHLDFVLPARTKLPA